MPIVEDQTWELSTIVDGFDAFNTIVAELSAMADDLTVQADTLGHPGTDAAWDHVIPALSVLSDRSHEVISWALCMAAADTADASCARAESRAMALSSQLQRAWSTPTSAIAQCDDHEWKALVARPALIDHVPALDRARSRRPVLLPAAQQQLFDELAGDALHGWGQRYRRISGQLRISLDGEALSPGQAKNRLEDDDADARSRTLDAIETAWDSVADSCADTLTRIVGVRRTLNTRLGVDELEVPLVAQRIQRQTLDALIGACDESRPLIGRYFAARASLLGKTHTDWQDLMAPVGQARLRVDWEAAQDLVADQVGAFSDDMGNFVRDALARRWVEAEDRPGKRPGAFCASFPISQESRVFLTYGGGANSVRTLAHELGHAYHNFVMADLPWAARRLTSCLAETASTFAETVVRDALLSSAQDPETRVALLDRELADAATFLVNIPVRFEFERVLFELRGKGPLDPAELSERMQALQRKWYGPSLGRAFPLFWAEKLHFYLTHVPFYNFPYTFGYLFSGMVYARAQEEGAAWAQGYRDLLRSTGRHTGEEVALRFLDIDLSDIAAWRKPIARLEPLVAELESMAAARR